MRPLLFSIPAWVAGLLPAVIVAQIILQLDLPKKWARWRTPAAGAAALAALTIVAILFRGASIPVHAYGVVLALAAVVAITIGVPRSPLVGFEPADMVDFGLYVVLAGVAGARVFHVAENFVFYFGPGGRGIFGAIAIWNGGLVFYGGMMGAMSYTAYYAFRHAGGLKGLVRIFDLGAPCALYGLALGRVGCFLNGCCFGSPTGLPWGVAYAKNTPLWRALVLEAGSRSSQWKHLLQTEGVREHMMPHTYHVHPQQLYASIFALALGTFLSWAFYKKWRRGTVSVLTLLIYPPARFIFEGWFRGDTPKDFSALPFTISQYVSVFAFAAGIVWGAVLLRRKRAETAGAPAGRSS
ncbi:MAG: prolipoprotein diacylglyceryl transferase [Planctomycetota bacterium]|jgi:phosphatidylglycerol:prolipoprotein diacylglycerol transferase